MGCDIHMVLQQKNGDDWEDIREIMLGRDYSLFTILAGVRGNPDNSIEEPRGLPKDFKVKKRFYNDGDGYSIYHKLATDGSDIFMGDHSFSWFTLDELDKSKKWKNYNKEINDKYASLFNSCKDRKNWRIVFGFDS